MTSSFKKYQKDDCLIIELMGKFNSPDDQKEVFEIFKAAVKDEFGACLSWTESDQINANPALRTNSLGEAIQTGILSQA